MVQLLALIPPSTRITDCAFSRSKVLTVRMHRGHKVARLVGYAFERRAGDFLPGRAARQADDRGARLAVPMRSAEPGESRHNIDPLLGVGL